MESSNVEIFSEICGILHLLCGLGDRVLPPAVMNSLRNEIFSLACKLHSSAQCFSAHCGGLMNLSTVRTAAIWFGVFTPTLSQAQVVTVTAKEIQHQSGLRLKLSLDAPSSSPAALQWEFKLAPGLRLATIEESESLKRAGKTLVCDGVKCLIYGRTRTTIPNGLIARITITQGIDVKERAQFADSSRIRDGKQKVQIAGLVAASVDGIAIDSVVIEDTGD
jgi:hypothetical protein